MITKYVVIEQADSVLVNAYGCKNLIDAQVVAFRVACGFKRPEVALSAVVASICGCLSYEEADGASVHIFTLAEGVPSAKDRMWFRSIREGSD